MATDATGAPTSLGIPTYNISVDAPSGIGSNSIAQAVDTLFVARTIPLTGTGDLLYASAPGTTARLPIGTTGQVLTVVGGAPAWTTLT